VTATADAAAPTATVAVAGTAPDVRAILTDQSRAPHDRAQAAAYAAAELALTSTAPPAYDLETTTRLAQYATEYHLAAGRARHRGAVCDECGGPCPVWVAPDDLFARVYPDGGHPCPPCFIRKAEAAGIGADGPWLVTPRD
jgi:hypothetical protein